MIIPSLCMVAFSAMLLTPRPGSDRGAPAAAQVTVFAGSLEEKGARDGKGEQARFNEPWGVGVDGQGNLYVADHWNDAIRRVRPDGTVETYAGQLGEGGYRGGVGRTARFTEPSELAVDTAGNVYLSGYAFGTIQTINRMREVTTLVGELRDQRHVDGMREAARLVQPLGITVDSKGRVWFVDACTVRRVEASGAVRTLVGHPSCVATVDGNEVRVEKRGAAAKLKGPEAIVADAKGNVFVSDLDAVVQVTPAADVRVIARARAGKGEEARPKAFGALALDSAGNLYCASLDDVWKVSMDGTLTNVAHLPDSSHGLAFDRRSGDLFVAAGHAILRIHLAC